MAADNPAFLGVLAPFVAMPNDGETIRMPDTSTVRILATGSQTSGRFAAMQLTYPVGTGFPMHINRKEDVAHYVVEGELLFVVGDIRVTATPDTFLYGPLGIEHGFRSVGAVPARVLVCFFPAGLEEMFSDPAELMSCVQEGLTDDKYGLEIVGPPPD